MNAPVEPSAELAPAHRLGVDAIDTPALVLDLDAMERNLQRMADFARKHGLRLRPHAKMHKSAELARLQIQAGAVGVCVQKVAEAEALVAGGVLDVLVTNEVIALPKLRRLAALARQVQARGRIGLCVDSAEGVRRLAAVAADSFSGTPATLDVYIEVDVGQHRCGVQPGPPAVALAREVQSCTGLRLVGLQAYQGGAQHVRSVKARREAIAVAADAVRYTLTSLQQAGIGPLRVTGAGTGSFGLEAASGVWNELQAGSYLFMDADYADNERDPAQPAFEHALFLKTQVISVNAQHAVCDAGHKSHAIDSGLPRVLPLELGRDLVYANGGDEHGLLRLGGNNRQLPALGQMLWLIPGHCDPTVNLHNQLIGVRGGLRQGSVERVIRVDARGALT